MKTIPPKYSCCKRIKTALPITSMLVAPQQMMGAEGRDEGLRMSGAIPPLPPVSSWRAQGSVTSAFVY